MNNVTVRLTIIFFAIIFIYSCRDKSNEEVGTPTAADVTAIETTLTNFSNAIAAVDSTTLQKLASPNFVLLDEGKDYDYPLMVQQIKTIHNMGTMTRKPQLFRTVIHKDVAWSYYQVLVNFRTQQKSIDLSLLESAVLEKTNEGWLIVMMTTAPQTVI